MTAPNPAPAASPIAAPDLPPYPAYRPAGVEWLGEVPAHWEVRRLRNVAEVRASNVDKHTVAGEWPVRLCNYVDVYHNDRITADLPFMRATAKAGEIARFRLEPGDVLITKDSETWRDIGVPALVEYAADDLVCGYHLAILRPQPDVVIGSYLFRALQSTAAASQFQVSANGVTRYGMSHNAVKSVRIPVPPPDEQAAIVRYLDAALGRIARARAAQARRAELLREYRQAAIQEAVTRGLDAAVPLRASGVEWLGEVPAHWEVRRLKYWVGINEQTLSESTDPSFDFRYLEIGGVGTGKLVAEPTRIRFANAPSRARRVVRTGDTIISTVRTYLKAVWFAENITDATICSTGFAVLTPRAGTAPKYVNYLAQSNFLTDRIVAESEGVAYPAIADSKFRAIHIPVPPVEEQAAIVAHLDGVTAAVDAGIARSERAAALLDEYGAGLIAAVVTGQVDVRAAV